MVLYGNSKKKFVLCSKSVLRYGGCYNVPNFYGAISTRSLKRGGGGKGGLYEVQKLTNYASPLVKLCLPLL